MRAAERVAAAAVWGVFLSSAEDARRRETTEDVRTTANQRSLLGAVARVRVVGANSITIWISEISSAAAATAAAAAAAAPTQREYPA